MHQLGFSSVCSQSWACDIRSQKPAELRVSSSIPCLLSCLYGNIGCSEKFRSLLHIISHRLVLLCYRAVCSACCLWINYFLTLKFQVTVFQGWVSDPSSARHTAYGIHRSASSGDACSFFSRIPVHESCLGGVWRGAPQKIQMERGCTLYSSVPRTTVLSMCFHMFLVFFSLP